MRQDVNIACVGDVMVDVFNNPDGSVRSVAPGGKCSNYAAAAAKTLGAQAHAIGLIGNDDWGRLCIGALDQVGVDRRFVAVTNEGPTGADFFVGDDWHMERGANWMLSADHVTRSLTTLHAEKPLTAVIVNQGVSSPASEAALQFCSLPTTTTSSWRSTWRPRPSKKRVVSTPTTSVEPTSWW